MSDRDLFEVFNASEGLHGGWLLLLRWLSSHVAWMALVAVGVTLVVGPAAVRRSMARVMFGAVLAAVLALLIALVFPQPRPADLSLGHQYLHPLLPSGFPSVHVTVLWSLAFGALVLRPTLAALGGVLLPLGLLVGWSRVYLGVQFPSDVLASALVAACAVGIVHLLRRPIEIELTGPLMRSIDARTARWRRLRAPRR
ncbi:phosphatase PAP2 family protein [Aquincola sp. MAHUQ-54]|uniref:Phosphatase PAP2 family protein n=1 Tax=Aquincola agrisoli TaxID=3119538 RepID=A0AAW9QAA7_9BURK